MVEHEVVQSPVVTRRRRHIRAREGMGKIRTGTARFTTASSPVEIAPVHLNVSPLCHQKEM